MPSVYQPSHRHAAPRLCTSYPWIKQNVQHICTHIVSCPASLHNVSDAASDACTACLSFALRTPSCVRHRSTHANALYQGPAPSLPGHTVMLHVMGCMNNVPVLDPSYHVSSTEACPEPHRTHAVSDIMLAVAHIAAVVGAAQRAPAQEQTRAGTRSV